jgi:pyridinium-3,5-biscarboxylic acid mononucleotide sulfurtransferase
MAESIVVSRSGAPWTADRLIEQLRPGGPAAVALSGGVDSAVVAALLFRAIGAEAWAVTLTSPAVTEAEVARARRVAGEIGLRYATVAVDPLAAPSYRANPTNRCYFCRSVESAGLLEWGRHQGIARYFDGIHRDDLGDDRPGVRAMDEAGVRHPLLEAGWRKADIRAFARSIGLSNADEPSDACLASRVAHGEPITASLLARIAEAEADLRARGFRRVRVRVVGGAARVEVDPGEVERLLAEPMATEIAHALAARGFATVLLDPAGYRTRAAA